MTWKLDAGVQVCTGDAPDNISVPFPEIYPNSNGTQEKRTDLARKAERACFLYAAHCMPKAVTISFPEKRNITRTDLDILRVFAPRKLHLGQRYAPTNNDIKAVQQHLSHSLAVK